MSHDSIRTDIATVERVYEEMRRHVAEQLDGPIDGFVTVLANYAPGLARCCTQLLEENERLADTALGRLSPHVIAEWRDKIVTELRRRSDVLWASGSNGSNVAELAESNGLRSAAEFIDSVSTDFVTNPEIEDVEADRLALRRALEEALTHVQPPTHDVLREWSNPDDETAKIRCDRVREVHARLAAVLATSIEFDSK